MRLVPAAALRAWMSATPSHFANRCLPLLMANQSGWFVLNSYEFTATWNGGPGLQDVKLECPPGPEYCPAGSHFGHGIITMSLPYLFRTPPGYNLLVRGAPNWPKDGACALEGLVETDWSVATFTMNWKLTRADHPVHFAADEPLCMLVPVRRGELEGFHPVTRPLSEAPELLEEYRKWTASRARFLVDLRLPGSEATKQAWQRHYFQGMTPDGVRAPEHQIKLDLRDFAGQDGADGER